MKKVAIVIAVLIIGVVGYLIFRRIRPILPQDDMIEVYQPLPESKISSPLVVRGRARGTWFFEASFPIILTDWDGRIIAQMPAQAKTDWMTTDWVEFEAVLTFDRPSYGERGSLILRKDNPSGLPEHDDAQEITVFFQ